MSHWTYTEIRNKIENKCKLEDVLLVYNSSTYMSQRCSSCGLVLKSNRVNKNYACKNCGLEIDSDLNSSYNHQQELFELPYGLRNLKLNIKGFYWKPGGIYTLNGEELSVSLSKNE